MKIDPELVHLQSFLSKLDKTKTSICYVDSILHFKRAQQVQELSETEILFLTNNKSLTREIRNLNYDFIYFKNYFSLLKIIFDLRKQKFNFYMAACVDQLYFHLVYFLCSFSFFTSIDEGIFSVDKFSRFNAEEKFDRETHKLFFYLEKIFSYPKVPKYFLKESLFHFGWFNKNLYKNTILEDRVVLMKPLSKPQSEKLKVFIGQPFKWMGLDCNNENQIISFIKNERIDIYLQHPRETKYNSIISNISCPIVFIDTNAENFLNMLSHAKLSIFSYMSSAIFGINQRVNINVLSLPVNRELQIRHDAFIDMLQVSEIKYNIVQHDR